MLKRKFNGWTWATYVACILFTFPTLSGLEITGSSAWASDKLRDRIKIRKKIREIKVLKAKGMKLKKMIELEQGFLEEKSSLKNIDKEVDEEDKKGKTNSG